MNREIKSLQQIFKIISSISGIDVPDIKKLLQTLLKHTLNLTNISNAFLVKEKRGKFYPQLHIGSYNDKKIDEILSRLSSQIDLHKEKQYIGDNLLIYTIETRKSNRFIIFLKSSSSISDEYEKTFILYLKAAANVIETGENYKKYLEKEKIAAIGLAANMIIHDFKNPLASIENIINLIKETSQDEVIIECVDIIYDAVEELNLLTREILDFSKGKKALELQNTSVPCLISNVREHLQLQLEENNIFFESICLFDNEIIADKKKLERVLINLIRNSIEALKSKKQEKKIIIKVEKTDENIRFSLSDNGKGIPDDIKERIFEPFVTRHTVGGTGLGMAIVKQIIESHKGEITFETRPGEGTKFVFTIPVNL
ncbi:MAG TPA: HAMP domain-containing sensor histidine kinase [Candidatus Eremiobacteraeota bacterium]|nr:MAG: Sensor protein ZraS [bacterium ADurb.Bin363]HPZ08295.1 HAMP domain-containing sensor histidine kinase [Candidatus Eremiobacteraeota bacterium]